VNRIHNQLNQYPVIECEREHAVADQLLDDADALAVLPYELLRGEVIPGNLD
jgi:hypothetical protein